MKFLFVLGLVALTFADGGMEMGDDNSIQETPEAEAEDTCSAVCEMTPSIDLTKNYNISIGHIRKDAPALQFTVAYSCPSNVEPGRLIPYTLGEERDVHVRVNSSSSLSNKPSGTYNVFVWGKRNSPPSVNVRFGLTKDCPRSSYLELKGNITDPLGYRKKDYNLTISDDLGKFLKLAGNCSDTSKFLALNSSATSIDFDLDDDSTAFKIASIALMKNGVQQSIIQFNRSIILTKDDDSKDVNATSSINMRVKRVRKNAKRAVRLEMYNVLKSLMQNGTDSICVGVEADTGVTTPTTQYLGVAPASSSIGMKFYTQSALLLGFSLLTMNLI